MQFHVRTMRVAMDAMGDHGAAKFATRNHCQTLQTVNEPTPGEKNVSPRFPTALMATRMLRAWKSMFFSSIQAVDGLERWKIHRDRSFTRFGFRRG
jgi:hypothetical protein